MVCHWHDWHDPLLPADMNSISDPAATHNPRLDALGQLHPPATGEVRIVSLVPSLTELVCELDLVEQLVGRTGFCIHPRDIVRRIAKVGGTKDVNLGLLRELKPTHLLVNIDENRRQIVDEVADFIPHIIVTHPCTPTDNFALYRLLGAIFGREQRAAELSHELEQALAEAARLRAGFEAENVLYLIWREPWMTVARATYISAMLAEVGWHTLPASSELRYPELDWQLARAVARVFLATEPYHFKADDLPEVEALSGRPASIIDGEMLSWYGSRAIAGVRYLCALRSTLAAASR